MLMQCWLALQEKSRGLMRKFCLFFIVALISANAYAEDIKLFEYPENLERDPFDALVDSNGVLNVRLVRQEGDLEISGLVYSENSAERIVIVNHEVLREGDIFGAYLVKQILSNKVILEKKGKIIELNMEGDDED